MQKFIKIVILGTTIITALMILIYISCGNRAFITLAISFGTIFYHFAMRLLIGNFYQLKFNNKIDYKNSRFKVSKTEFKLYQAIKVKRWKKYLPTYDHPLFDISNLQLENIAMAMCQAELIHKTIITFSFLPIISSIWLGGIEVFIVTSIIAALIDLAFVIVQRYNRARIMRILAEDLPPQNQNKELAT